MKYIAWLYICLCANTIFATTRPNKSVDNQQVIDLEIKERIKSIKSQIEQLAIIAPQASVNDLKRIHTSLKNAQEKIEEASSLVDNL